MEAADLNAAFGPKEVIIESGDTSIVCFMNQGGESFGGPLVLSGEFQFITDFTVLDMDADGDRDIVVADTDQGKVYQLINAGSFIFGALEVIAEVGSRITDLQIADINGDGDDDLIYCSMNSAEIGWIENEGNGDFALPEGYSVSNGLPDQIRAADLNDDDILDLLYLDIGLDEIFYLQNTGPVFSDPESIWSGTEGLEDFEIADIDMDGDLDIALCSRYQSKIIWIEQENGTFATSHLLDDSAYSVDQLEIADFDQDGDPDVVATSRSSNFSKWYLNDGTGDYGVGGTPPPTNGKFPWVLRAADFSSDGSVDILYADDRMVYMAVNDGTGGFDALPVITPEIPYPGQLTDSDVNDDSFNDILVGGFFELNWLENEENSSYGVSNLGVLGYSSLTVGVDAGDVDQDGDTDICYSVNNGSRMLINDGEENFELEFTMTDPGSYMGTAFNDLDGDGDLDLILNHNTTIRIKENLGGGVLGPWEDVVTDVDKLISLHLADIDGDGDDDLIVGDVFPIMLSTYENLGGLEFGPQQAWLQESTGPRDIDLADVDGDGDQDILCLTDPSLSPVASILYYENDGEGNYFDSHLITCGINNPWCLDSGDFDQDGDEDIAIGAVSNLVLLYNNGSAGFAQKVLSNENYQIQDILASDRDGDGDLDLILARSLLGFVSYFENHLNEGCMDPDACNYDPNAIVDTGCCYNSCGCTDPQALNFDEAATCDNGSCQYIVGCTDPLASNYDPDATFDDGSCIIESGCAILGAENYDPDAACNDGSCGFLLHGIVFYDENENGVMDDDEYGIAQHEVSLLQSNQTYLTNSNGLFYSNATGSNDYTYEVQAHPLFPFYTTPSSLDFSADQDNWNQEIFFGLSNETPLAEISAELFAEFSEYPCDSLVIHDLCIQNLGNNQINTDIALTIDELYQEFIAIDPIDSLMGGVIHFSLDSLNPGENACFSFYLSTPTAEFLGDTLTIFYSVTAYSSDVEVATLTGDFHQELTCAYDPNDKQVFPEGYTEQHYV
ncbi:MAG: VCBS repeat-containing protein, partial [Flavobacteriales bacterium]|nr:VCBS repeat-containing protein [Flavobacteriales bacterium]